MKERLIQLLDLEQLTPSKFADIIGVQRSSVSHVISGRNKPSFDFIQKTLTAFPGLNAEWLILGQGSMYEQMGRGASGNLFEAAEAKNLALFPEEIPGEGAEKEISADSQEDKPEPEISDIPELTEPTEDSASELPQKDPVGTGKVVQVMVFYDNDTFKTYRPSN